MAFVKLIGCCLLQGSSVVTLGAGVPCTTIIVGDVVRQIAGEDIAVLVLPGPDTDPYSFQPRPRGLVLINGLGWISSLPL